MSFNTLLMSRATFEACVEESKHAEASAREMFRKVYGKEQGDVMVDEILDRLSQPGRGTPRLLIIED